MVLLQATRIFRSAELVDTLRNAQTVCAESFGEIKRGLIVRKCIDGSCDFLPFGVRIRAQRCQQSEIGEIAVGFWIDVLTGKIRIRLCFRAKLLVESVDDQDYRR